MDPEELLKAKRWIAKAGWGFTLLIVVIWPVLSTPAGVFTKGYFAFWIFIAVIWALVASFIIIALPIWESKDQILAVFDGIFHTNLCEYYNPETSKQHKLHQAAAAAVERVRNGPSVGGSFAARWARMVLKRRSSERGEREKRFYGDGKGERRRTAF